jgi:hypothetical protein
MGTHDQSPFTSPNRHLPIEDTVDEVNDVFTRHGFPQIDSNTLHSTRHGHAKTFSILKIGSNSFDVSPDWAARIKLHHALPRTVPAASLRLLVAISAQLSEEQYTLLMPPLWNHYLEEASRHIAAPVRPVPLHRSPG